MKNSVKVSFAAVVSALTAVLMTASLIPNITFAVPALAGLMMIAVFAQCGAIWSFSAFAVSSAISFFVSDKTSWLLYSAFFGFYPILKPIIERIKKPVIEWVLKLFLFNLSALVCYFAEIFISGLVLRSWILAAVWLSGNIVFVLYDIAVSSVAAFYYMRLHSRISRILKR